VRLAAPAIAIVDLLPAADLQKAVIAAFIAAYRERYGEPPSAFGGCPYDALMQLHAAPASADDSARRDRPARR
jgi:branched-chain amino acid transport system substrate-binding protein